MKARSFEQLSQYVKYDETSPSGLRWLRKHHYTIRDDLSCGSLNEYWTFDFAGKKRKCHRVIYEMFHGEIPDGIQIDHIDRDKTNNRIENLRLVTQSQNQRNIQTKMIRLRKVYRKSVWILQYTAKDGSKLFNNYSSDDSIVGDFAYKLWLCLNKKAEVIKEHYPELIYTGKEPYVF